MHVSNWATVTSNGPPYATGTVVLSVMCLCNVGVFGVGWIRIRLGKEVGLGPGDIVLDGRWGPSAPHCKRRSSPHFSAHVHCGQTAGWIRIPLVKEVGLGPGDIVLDGDPAPPLFGPCLLWSNGRPSQQLLSSCKYCVCVVCMFVAAL